MYSWRAFAPVLVYLSSVRIFQHCSLYLCCNRAVSFQVGARDAKLYGPRCIWSKNQLRGAHACFRRSHLFSFAVRTIILAKSGLGSSGLYDKKKRGAPAPM